MTGEIDTIHSCYDITGYSLGNHPFLQSILVLKIISISETRKSIVAFYGSDCP